MTDLELALKALTGKQADYDKFYAYYDGDQPLVYNAEKLREMFNGIDAKFTENWCGVVVDSALDRISLEGFSVADNEAATTRLNQLFAATELVLDADDAHRSALVTGEAFVIVWKDDDGLQAFYNDPRQCHVFYEPDNPRVKRLAAKWWRDDAGRRLINLYYADRIEYYRSQQPLKHAETIKPEAFNLKDEADNPFGIVPVFHLRRDRAKIASELANIIEPQNSLNKLVSDMMIAAEFGAFPQRYAISQVDIRGKLKNSPNEIWTIPASDGEGQATSVGEFGAAELSRYITAIDQRANTIAVISRTPKHYFFTQSGAPSGEALIVQESPLNKKVKRYVDRFAPVWRKVARFMLELDGVTVDEMAIEPMFAAVETVQPRTQAEIRQINVNAGLPLITVLKMEGWSKKDIDEMLKDADQMTAHQQAGIGAALLNAQQQFDQGQDPTVSEDNVDDGTQDPAN